MSKPQGSKSHSKSPSNSKPGNQIHCADCEYCRTFRDTSASGYYTHKVRCAKDHWRRGKSSQKNPSYPLHTVLRRVVPTCADYASLSEDEQDRALYLNTLEDDLPVERIVYDANGEAVLHMGVG